MAYTGIKIWAGATTTMTELPSPIELQVTRETIWSEDTGRSPSTGNMVSSGGIIAKKRTYTIKWGVLDSTDLSTITTNMNDDFFYFGVGATCPADPDKYYRSEITYDIIRADGTYYKDVSVQVIQK